MAVYFDTFENISLRWHHNDHAGVSNHQPHGCLLNRLFRRKSKKTSKLRVTGLCAGNSPGTGEFPAQMASYAENVSIWWRHHVICENYVSSSFQLLALAYFFMIKLNWTESHESANNYRCNNPTPTPPQKKTKWQKKPSRTKPSIVKYTVPIH